MEIETKQFGKIMVKERKILTMPAGMPGFPNMHRFVIIEREETWPFLWYQSVDDAELAFVIMSPYLFKPDYVIDLKSVVKEMEWNEESEDELEVYVVVNASEGKPERTTVNLMGPLIMNPRCREAVQMVFANSPYSHCHRIFSDATETE